MCTGEQLESDYHSDILKATWYTNTCCSHVVSPPLEIKTAIVGLPTIADPFLPLVLTPAMRITGDLHVVIAILALFRFGPQESTGCFHRGRGKGVVRSARDHSDNVLNGDRARTCDRLNCHDSIPCCRGCSQPTGHHAHKQAQQQVRSSRILCPLVPS